MPENSIYSPFLFPFNYIQGCIAYSPGGGTDPTTVITPGNLRDDANQINISVTSTITITGTASGANGLDVGSLATSTVYAVYVIADPSNVLPPAGLLSLSLTAPLMPTVLGVTYGAKRLVGFAKTSSNLSTEVFVHSFVCGDGSFRSMKFDFLDAANVILSNVSASTSPTAIPLTNFVPPSGVFNPCAVLVTINAYTTSADTTGVIYLSESNSSDLSPSIMAINSTVATVPISFGEYTLPVANVSGIPNIYYQANEASMTLTVNLLGFQFSV